MGVNRPALFVCCAVLMSQIFLCGADQTNLSFVASDPVVVFDDTPGLGRTFDGIGAISGGGATSKLLVNYEDPYRSEVLDYLFTPGFGASLQIFKVEIGGDMQSTDGTEASHMRNSWEENYHRGYEWWLMKEAKLRNPNIKLSALCWGFPGWLGNGNNSPYVDLDATAGYVVRWISAARDIHNLTIDYIGVWNERAWNDTYIKTLRKALDDKNLRETKIVASDNFGWDIAKDMLSDAELARSIYAVGAHYTGTYSTSQAVETGKPLWASEDYNTFNDEVGGGCWARIINQNYVNGFMTSTIAWNMVASYYQGLKYYRTALMTAMEPWSGHYDVDSPIWVTAHTTQFVPVGSFYLNHSSGVGALPHGGSYVSFTNEAKDELTIVVETMSHDHSICIRPDLPAYNVTAQNITIHLKGSFKDITELNVWYTKLGFDGEEDVLFEKRKPLSLKNGQATIQLGIDELLTLTTHTAGKKGQHPTPPPSKPFPDELEDDFSTYSEHEEPFYLAPQVGSLEVITVNGQKVARQPVLQTPVHWCDADTVGKPISLVGNFSLADMAVSVSFDIPPENGTDGVFLAARVDNGGCSADKSRGIFFFVFPSQSKYVLTNDLAGKEILEEGTVSFGAGPHFLYLLVQEPLIVGALDGAELIHRYGTPADPPSGFAAIGTNSFGLADFYEFTFNRVL